MAEGVAEATSGAAGALAAALVFYPLDLVRTRIQSQLGSDDGAPQYRGIVDGFVQRFFVWLGRFVDKRGGEVNRDGSMLRDF